MTEIAFTQEEANQFIINCHMDLDKVQARLAENPALASAFNPELNESALGAAGHMGRPDIAQLLLEHGAEMELAAAAMLGDRDYVRAALDRDPALAASGGAHNIPVAFHAAMSGDTQIMQMLWDAGAEGLVRGALFFAVWKDQLPMARWLLESGASVEGRDPQGRSVLEVAEANGNTEMVALLKEARA
jgi:ankyrin repeat protein